MIAHQTPLIFSPSSGEISQKAEISTCANLRQYVKIHEFPPKIEIGTPSAISLGIKAGWSGRHKPGNNIMSIAKFQNAAFALVGAVMFASLFVAAAVPVVPIA
ncbi:hypothetical protein [Sphingobium sp.]|uniref:hypothetical protein n=1 Tax=Sphingobium sp. TaxID=1912891 RepID=UPI002D02408A|nr:hypothetical protein [Sphingobium sp.]HUD93191.1 hypothetical protein [Sphingobium sp.]